MSRLRRLTLSPLERRAMYRIMFENALTDRSVVIPRAFVATMGLWIMRPGKALKIWHDRVRFIERYGYAPMGALRCPSGATWLRYGWQTLGRSNDGSGR